jgi:plasmid stability protein
MKDVLLRGLPEDVVERLKKRAEINNRSLQAELREILEREANKESIDTSINMVREIFYEYKDEGRTFSDSAETQSEERSR